MMCKFVATIRRRQIAETTIREGNCKEAANDKGSSIVEITLILWAGLVLSALVNLRLFSTMVAQGTARSKISVLIIA